MIAFLLTKQIFQLYLIMACGYFAVRLGLLRAEESRTLSVLLVYIVIPCTIIGAFQIEYKAETARNFLLAVISAVILHILLFILAGLSDRALRCTPIEKASLIYSNAGNLIIPLVTAVLGKEWVVYASAFMLVQTFLFWSHGKALIQGVKKTEPAYFLKNVNLIACFTGLFLFLLRLRLPAIVTDTMQSIASLIGPLSMLMLGMILAGTDIKKMISRRIWIIALLKMVVQPAVLVLILKYSGLAGFSPDGTMILFISLLAVMTPSATSVTQLAQLYNKEPQYAMAINTVTTVACLVTMPLLTALYYL